VLPLLESDPQRDLPVVVAFPPTFLELEHYASPALAARLYYLTDIQAAARWSGNIYFDSVGPSLRDWFPFRANFEDYRSFVTRHERFLVVENGWVPQQLSYDGAVIQPKGTLAGIPYYEVFAKR
jgi:hypothetical protein